MKLLFLGRLADVAGAAELDVPNDAPMGWDEVIARLEPELRAAVAAPEIRVAHNGVLIADRDTLRARTGDEVAFLPPVSGGWR